MRRVNKTVGFMLSLLSQILIVLESDSSDRNWSFRLMLAVARVFPFSLLWIAVPSFSDSSQLTVSFPDIEVNPVDRECRFESVYKKGFLFSNQLLILHISPASCFRNINVLFTRIDNQTS